MNGGYEPISNLHVMGDVFPPSRVLNLLIKYEYAQTNNKLFDDLFDKESSSISI